MVNRNKTDKAMIELMKKVFGEVVYEQSIRNQSKPISSASFKQSVVLESTIKFVVRIQSWKFISRVPTVSMYLCIVYD